MKKYLSYIVVFFALFILTACGGGSDNIPNSGSSADSNVGISSSSTPIVNTDNYTLEVQPTDFNISTPGDNKAISLFVVNSRTNKPAAGVVVDAEAFPMSNGTLDKYEATTNANGQVVFTYTAPDTLPPAGFDITFKFDNATTPNPKIVNVGISSSSTPIVNTDNYTLEVQPTDFNISTPGDNKAISLFVVNSRTNKPAAGVVVDAEAFPMSNGTLDKYEATTNANGQVVFTYTAPDTLPPAGFDITFKFDNATTPNPKIVNVGISSSSTPIVNTDNYTLEVQPTDFNISTPGDNKAISLFVVNSRTNKPAAGVVVDAEAFPMSNGTLDKYEATTNANGQVVFTYTAPDTLPPAGFDITFKFDNATTPNPKIVNVGISSSSTPIVNTDNYTLEVQPTDFNISTPGDNKAISLFVVNSRTNKPAAGVVVDAEAFPMSNGTLDKYEATTNANGQVVFTYTAPDTLPPAGFDITFKFDNATTPNPKIVNVGISSSSTPIVNTDNYTLEVQPTDFNISTPGDNKAISLFVVNSRTNKPAAGVVVDAEAFPMSNGTLDKYEATTNANGQVVFTYTAPDTLPPAGFDITFKFDNATTPNPKIVNVGISSSSTPIVNTDNYTLEVQPTDFNISTPGDNKAISLFVVNSRTNKPAAGVVVDAEAFPMSNGTLDKYEATTNANGQVVFTYTAPDTLPPAGFDITFKFDNATTPNPKIVNVGIVSPKYFIIPDQNITVTEANQKKSISVSLYRQIPGEGNVSAVGESVIAEFIMPINGKLAKYEAIVDSSGVAEFLYTSPKRTLPSSDVNVTFYHKEDRSTAGETQIIFDPQVIDTVSDMFVTPMSFTVTKAKEEKEIAIVTVNSSNIGISSTVQLEQPIDGTDYGQFSETNVTTNASGYAVVKYTAPADIDKLVEKNITVTELSQNIKKELNIKFNTGTSQYEIVGVVPKSVAVDKIGSLGIKISKIIQPHEVIQDKSVNEVNLTSQFSNMLLFENDADSITYPKLGENKQITIKSLTLSGVAVIHVSASIFDGTKNVTITKDIPITIISGPVTAISIPYVGNSKCITDQTQMLYASNYLIHAVDKYNNPAQVRITATLINNAKIIALNPSYKDGNGSLSSDALSTKFVDNTQGFKDDVREEGDRLIIIPNTNYHSYDYLGSWTINEVEDNNTLRLLESYDGPKVDNLSYVIGNETRFLGGNLAVSHVLDPTGKNKTDGNGTLLLEVCFDPALAAHTFTLSAYSQDNNRTGIATVTKYGWNDFTSPKVSINNNTSEQNVTLGIRIGGTLDEPLIDVDIDPSSVVTDSSHCVIDEAKSNYHTDEFGKIYLSVKGDGIKSTAKPPGVDTCTIEWKANAYDVKLEY